MKIKIKSRWSGEVLYVYGYEQNTLLKSLQAAMKCSAKLYGANLRGADLRGANLGEEYGKLVGDRPVFAIGPIGSCSDQLMVFLTDKGEWFRAGYFFGTREKFIENLTREHGDNIHAQEYLAAIALADKHVELWSKK